MTSVLEESLLCFTNGILLVFADHTLVKVLVSEREDDSMALVSTRLQEAIEVIFPFFDDLGLTNFTGSDWSELPLAVEGLLFHISSSPLPKYNVSKSERLNNFGNLRKVSEAAGKEEDR